MNQLHLGEKVHRVVNHGIPVRQFQKFWDSTEYYRSIFDAMLREQYYPGDICIIITPTMPLLAFRHLDPDPHPSIILKDLVSAFDRPHDQGEVFLDPTHFSHRGAFLVARKIFSILRETSGESNTEVTRREHGKRKIFVPASPGIMVGNMEQTPTIETLLKKYRTYLEQERREVSGLIGASVMNCNPFTLGHRYLIEQATKQCDFLEVFCVEKDVSDFSFSERFDLLKQGTADMAKIHVLRSGSLVLSIHTFPEYFAKENCTKVTQSPAMDIHLFGKYIAPILNITKHFAGSEPNCQVTAAYNTAMKEELPKYGIDFSMFERMVHANVPISASLVRRFIREGNVTGIAALTSKTTFDFIRKKHGL